MIKYDYCFREIDLETIDISQVPRELSKRESYICPMCRERFTAVVRSPDSDYRSYFRHYKNTEKRCSENHVNETALHERAKKVIEEHKKIYLPPYVVKLKRFMEEPEFENLPDWVLAQLPSEYIYQPETVLQCLVAKREQRISDIRSDVMAYTLEGEYIIEIYVTHRVPPEKITKAAALHLHMLEVDLHDVDRTISEEDLRSAIIESWEKTKWRCRPDEDKIFAAAREHFLNIAKELIRKEKERRRKEEERRRREAEKAKQREEERLRQEQLARLQEAKQKESVVEEHKAPIAEKIPEPVMEDIPETTEELVEPARPEWVPKTIEWLINENKGDFDRNFPIYDGNPHAPRRRYLCVRCNTEGYGSEMKSVGIMIDGVRYENKGFCKACQIKI